MSWREGWVEDSSSNELMTCDVSFGTSDNDTHPFMNDFGEKEKEKNQHEKQGVSEHCRETRGGATQATTVTAGWRRGVCTENLI